jgi:hypothetical protein
VLAFKLSGSKSSANAGTHFQRPREQQPCLAFFGVGVWSSIRLGGQPISSRQC